VSADQLGILTYQHIERDAGSECAHRYLVWADFIRSGRPLLLLINGTSASGKSTISTEVASRLEIVRTQSTDMLRQVMRMLIPDRLIPVLHTSSFEAWLALPGHPGEEQAKSSRLLITGFIRQAELLEVACEAVLDRAVQERVSLVLEGVHIQPSLLEKIPQEADAVVVPVTLAVLKRDHLLRHVQGRGTETPQRRSERYLANFDAIWRIQSYLLSEADRAGIPIVVNEDKETAIGDVIRLIGDVLAKDFSRTPQQVFATTQGSPTLPAPPPPAPTPGAQRPWLRWWRQRAHR
jgi:2-phosphoglycerate kinase